jgi:hypothetical protein
MFSPSGETLMKALAFVAAIALALAASGCMSQHTTIDSAKAGTGTVPKTRAIEI